MSRCFALVLVLAPIAACGRVDLDDWLLGGDTTDSSTSTGGDTTFTTSLGGADGIPTTLESGPGDPTVAESGETTGHDSSGTTGWTAGTSPDPTVDPTVDPTGSTTGPGIPADNIGGCCVAHPETGCEYPSVSACVCASRPECCELGWDDSCVEGVDALGCGVCPPADPSTTDPSTTDPSTSDTGEPPAPDDLESCCSPHASTGCEYPGVSACVCDVDPACCAIGWDDGCVDQVDSLGCGVCPP